jgi:hypothetical protein
MHTRARTHTHTHMLVRCCVGVGNEALDFLKSSQCF